MVKDDGRAENDGRNLNSKQKVKRRLSFGTVGTGWVRFLSRSGKM